MALEYDDFPLKTYDKLRFRDTDRQGHVNNALFSTFLETGRTELLYLKEPLLDQNATFVIAKLNLDLKGEINWPGTVEIGTKVTKVGNSSINIYQKLFHNNQVVAEAETVIVQIDSTTRKSKKLTRKAVQILEQYI